MAYENPRPSAPELGSTLPEVLNDNLTTLDLYANETAKYVTNRKGEQLLTLFGGNEEIQNAIANAGFDTSLGDWAIGKTITAYNQVLRFDGEFYKLTPATSLPHTVDGADPDADSGEWLLATAQVSADYGSVSAPVGNGAIEVKHRRGTDAEIMAGIPAAGELWINLTDNSIHLGDGVTQGGIKHMNAKTLPKYAELVFNSVTNMQAGVVTGGESITHDEGNRYIVSGEFNVFSHYVVGDTGEIDLGGGLWAKKQNIDESFKDWSETATTESVQAVVDGLDGSAQARILGTPEYSDLVQWKGRRHLTDDLPFLVNSVEVPDGGLNARMTVSGGILYVCGFAQNRVEMFSLADPRNPRYIGNIPTGLDPRHVAAVGKIVIVCCLGSNEIRFYDISLINNIIQIGAIPTESRPKMFELVGNDIYVICETNNRLQKFTFYLPNDEKATAIEGKFEFYYRKIADVLTCDDPLCCSVSGNGIVAVSGFSDALCLHGAQTLVLISNTSVGTGSHGVCQFVGDTHVLLTDWGESKVYSVRVTDVTSPVVADTVGVVSNPEQLQIVGDRLYVPQLDTGTAHLSAVDIVDAENMYEFKQVPLTVGEAGFTAYHQVGENGYVYVNGHSSPFNIDVVEVVPGRPSKHERHAQDVIGVREITATSAKIGVADMRQSYETFIEDFTVSADMNVVRGGLSSGSLTATLPDPALSPNKQFTLCNVGTSSFVLNVSNAYHGFGGTINYRGSVTLLSTVFGGIWQWDVIGGGEYTP